jgi:hypothetical protein
MIAADDLQLFDMCSTPEEAWASLIKQGLKIIS